MQFELPKDRLCTFEHGKPRGVVRDDQPDAREGQAGRPGRRKGSQYRGSRVTLVEGRGLSPRQTQDVARDLEIGQPINSEERSEPADGGARESEGRSRLSLLHPIRQDQPGGHPGACLRPVPLQRAGTEDDDPAEDNDDAESENWSEPHVGSGERHPCNAWEEDNTAAGWPPEKKAAHWEEQSFNRRQSVVCNLLRQPAEPHSA